jgi:hypothetical protein
LLELLAVWKKSPCISSIVEVEAESTDVMEIDIDEEHNGAVEDSDFKE